MVSKYSKTNSACSWPTAVVEVSKESWDRAECRGNACTDQWGALVIVIWIWAEAFWFFDFGHFWRPWLLWNEMGKLTYFYSNLLIPSLQRSWVPLNLLWGLLMSLHKWPPIATVSSMVFRDRPGLSKVNSDQMVPMATGPWQKVTNHVSVMIFPISAS